MKISRNKVVALVAAGIISTQGYMLVEKNKQNVELTKSFANQTKILDSTVREKDEALANLELKTEDNKKQSEKISNLESEKVRLSKEITKLKSNAYPTQSVSRGSSTRGVPIQMTLTFYGSGADENGGYAGQTASGAPLTPGTVASNVYPFGTQFSYNGKIYTVRDKGGSNFNSSNRLDVFVDASQAELNRLGKQTVTMYKLN